ncbi:hypothetical protein ACOMHN_020600 [Nucella lapillus]
MLVHGEAPEIPGVTKLCDYMVKTWVDDQRPLFHREKETAIAVHRLNFGHPPPPKLQAFKLKEDRIMRIKTQLQNGQRGLLNYMDAMGTTVKMQ